MGNYLLNEEQISGVAGKIEELAGDLKTRIDGVDNAITDLVNAVHGQASDNCTEQWNTAKDAMTSYIPKMNDVAARVRAAATTTADVDATLSDFTVEAEARS